MNKFSVNLTLWFLGLLFVALGSVIVLGVICIFAERVSPSPDLVPNSLKVRVPHIALFKISSLYALAGILVTLSLDEERVLCHLQDPIKGIVLVFSLVYYFFFCRKSKFCSFSFLFSFVFSHNIVHLYN